MIYNFQPYIGTTFLAKGLRSLHELRGIFQYSPSITPLFGTCLYIKASIWFYFSNHLKGIDWSLFLMNQVFISISYKKTPD